MVLVHDRLSEFLYKCMKFGWNSSDGYQVIEKTWNSIANDQREITPKISTAELWFLCIWKINMQELWFLMTRRLNVLYKCMKFLWNTSNGFQVIERTRFCDGQTDRWTDEWTPGEKLYVSRPFQRGGGGGHNNVDQTKLLFTALTLCLLGNFLWFFSNLTFSKFSSGLLPSEWQTVWIQIITELPSQLSKLGRHRHASETPFEWHAGRL